MELRIQCVNDFCTLSSLSATQVESQWKKLNDASAEKKKKLAEATEALLFNLSMDDIETQIAAMETQLASEDHGADLPAAGALLNYDSRSPIDQIGFDYHHYGNRWHSIVIDSTHFHLLQ